MKSQNLSASILSLALLALLPIRESSGAQPVAPEDPVHDALRQLRSEVVGAIEKSDFDATVRHVHPDAVITWQNHAVNRGTNELRAFFNQTASSTFKGYRVPPNPDALTILHGGDTGISYGHTVATYEILGKTVDVTNRWTATLIKDDAGDWKIAAYHVSLNALDNPILDAAGTGLYLAGGLAGIGGLLIGFLGGKRCARKCGKS